jgi:hypothetical protein
MALATINGSVSDDAYASIIMGILIAGGIAVLFVFVRQRRTFAALPRKRVYSAEPERVSAAAQAAIEKLGYGISYIDEQAITFAPTYIGRALLIPVVHLVMLPTGDGRTEVEVIGARTRSDYNWNVMALALLKELDESLQRA